MHTCVMRHGARDYAHEYATQCVFSQSLHSDVRSDTIVTADRIIDYYHITHLRLRHRTCHHVGC